MRLLFSAVSPGGRRGRLTILIFHRVTPKPDAMFPSEVDAEAFDRTCTWIRRWFNVLPLDLAIERLRHGDLPSRALAITFDDGYADNHDVALPILQRHGLTATFFIATGFLDGGRMWNDTVIESLRRTTVDRLDLRGLASSPLGEYVLDSVIARRRAIGDVLAAIKYLSPVQRADSVAEIALRSKAELPTDLMMTATQVRSLHRAGMQIGAHTVSHPILRTLGGPQAEREMRESRERLESIVGASVALFAYPNGRPGQDYDDRDVALARGCGFSAAVSTMPGAASSSSDCFQLPRFTPWRRARLPFAAQLAHNLITRS